MEVVVLVGKAAQKAWAIAKPPLPRSIAVLRCPHPSPQNVNTRPAARQEILDAFADAAARLVASDASRTTCPSCGTGGVPETSHLAGGTYVCPRCSRTWSGPAAG
ncbi:hypothetical protein GH723_04230 [Actinomarinicola tropica]|uniref:Uncharacterized protein n=1 Tax=Actinomarinicola tropica TaxID=2789776 RepID=A0A5Q2RR81_9ACTN|nr:hypothetical protein GH723_04230 [Actinomarinicola tropica]